MFQVLNRSLVVLLVMVAASSLPVSAQQRMRRTPLRRVNRTTIAQSTNAPPVALVQQTQPDYLSGEANVAVRGNMNPIIKLGLSQNGVTMIEFPVSDRFFAIHPGNSELVTIDESPTKATDHFLVLRAGSGFSSPTVTASVGRGPVTSIIVQMQSGMVITFLMYPVQQLSQQAHRCVVSYDRNEVIAARRAAGLAVNLDGTEPPTQTTTASLRVAPASPSTSPTPAASPSLRGTEPAVADIDTKQSPSKRQKRDGGDPVRAAINALSEATKSTKNFKKWTDPVHGLAVSISQARDVDARSRVVVIAVRNTEASAIRIVPNQPDIYVETVDEKGKPLQVEQLKKLGVQTTTVSDQIPAGAVCYYALVYETPTLGARQRLRVSVAQMDAADEPSRAELTSSTR